MEQYLTIIDITNRVILNNIDNLELSDPWDAQDKIIKLKVDALSNYFDVSMECAECLDYLVSKSWCSDSIINKLIHIDNIQTKWHPFDWSCVLTDNIDNTIYDFIVYRKIKKIKIKWWMKRWILPIIHKKRIVKKFLLERVIYNPRSKYIKNIVSKFN
jgi:hypothetical protein